MSISRDIVACEPKVSSSSGVSPAESLTASLSTGSRDELQARTQQLRLPVLHRSGDAHSAAPPEQPRGQSLLPRTGSLYSLHSQASLHWAFGAPSNTVLYDGGFRLNSFAYAVNQVGSERPFLIRMEPWAQSEDQVRGPTAPSLPYPPSSSLCGHPTQSSYPAS